jgi:hypothetical protein
VSNPQSITPDAYEILVGRELRRIGIEPVQLRRVNVMHSYDHGEYGFDLQGRLEAYGRRWSVLIECHNRPLAVESSDVSALRTRADNARAASAVLFTTSGIDAGALAAARADAIPLLRVVDAQTALMATGVIQAGQLPAWLPEYTIELVTSEGSRLLEASDPELLLRELRPQQ